VTTEEIRPRRPRARAADDHTTRDDGHRGSDEGRGGASDTFGRVIGATPPWGARNIAELESVLLSGSDPFPCTFAVSAVKRETLRYGFVEESAKGGWDELAGILREYLTQYREIGRETSLVVFFPPEEDILGIADYGKRFWSIMQYLHDHDTHPWPADVATDPADATWEFSFAGESIFVVCNTPAHVRRRSRSSPGFFITFQPRWVFEGLESTTARGAAARRVIRERLRRYDDMEPSTVLGSYGDEDNREWRQYFLTDVDEPSPGVCPFRPRQG
jgi:FPC/CPF motif-containing protein YcgG